MTTPGETSIPKQIEHRKKISGREILAAAAGAGTAAAVAIAVSLSGAKAPSKPEQRPTVTAAQATASHLGKECLQLVGASTVEQDGITYRWFGPDNQSECYVERSGNRIREVGVFAVDRASGSTTIYSVSQASRERWMIEIDNQRPDTPFTGTELGYVGPGGDTSYYFMVGDNDLREAYPVGGPGSKPTPGSGLAVEAMLEQVDHYADAAMSAS